MKRRNRNGDAAADSVFDAKTLARISDAVAPVTPAPALAARMRQRVMSGAQADATIVVRANEGEWKKLLPGITIKTLHLDKNSGTQTSLWRLQPGARIPPHPHAREEECLILEGSIVHDGVTYSQGDFLRHKDFIAPDGALLMIRGELIPNRWLLKFAMLLPH
jgi:anti-sigma factor ChrR (cupin superfamily)